MAVLFLICGLPGSGKTTLARQIEASEGAVRLSPDDWMLRLGIDGFDEDRRAAIEHLQWEIAQDLLARGQSVVMESGFWSKRERMAFRARAAELGAASRLCYLDVPIEELKRRIAKRNERPDGESFTIDPDLIDTWAAQFEAPREEEL